jgi:hypothetical protein
MPDVPPAVGTRRADTPIRSAMKNIVAADLQGAQRDGSSLAASTIGGR